VTVARAAAPSPDAALPRSLAGSIIRSAEPVLARAARLVEQRVDEIENMIHDMGGEASTYGAHGIGLVDHVRESMRVPGKRVRPTLAHAGFSAAGGVVGSDPRRDEDLVCLSAALEVLHLFAVIHDDVMDRAATRRGRPTVHHVAAARHVQSDARGDGERFGDSVAVLVGDLLLSEAGDLVRDLAAPVRRAWRRMIVELVHGQLLDLTATASPRAPEAKASRRVARLKTGRYTVRRPVELGALLVTSSPSVIEPLGAWGDLVGDAFGLRDDVIGVWGDPSTTGKPAQQDLREGTATVLLAWARESLPVGHPAGRLLEDCRAYGLDAVQARSLAAAMHDSGVRERAESEIARILDEADALLANVPLGGPPETREYLIHLSQMLALRIR